MIRLDYLIVDLLQTQTNRNVIKRWDDLQTSASLMFDLVLAGLSAQLLQLRVELHEPLRHAVDASVQEPVLAVILVELLLVALSLVGAGDHRVRPVEGSTRGTKSPGSTRVCWWIFCVLYSQQVVGVTVGLICICL